MASPIITSERWVPGVQESLVLASWSTSSQHSSQSPPPIYIDQQLLVIVSIVLQKQVHVYVTRFDPSLQLCLLLDWDVSYIILEIFECSIQVIQKKVILKFYPISLVFANTVTYSYDKYMCICVIIVMYITITFTPLKD